MAHFSSRRHHKTPAHKWKFPFIPRMMWLHRRAWKQYLVISFVICIIFSLLAMMGILWLFSRDLPSPEKLRTTGANSTIVYDKSGAVLHEFFVDKQRDAVSSAEIGDLLKKATIAIEDKNFYTHKGYSIPGFIRAVISVVTCKAHIGSCGGLKGGSTITQQLIKNTLLDNSRTMTRKLKELILAVRVEQVYSKDEILTMYLNEAAYGGTYYGVGAAARGYFDKEPKELTLLEAACIAGLPQAPSVYSPFVGAKGAWQSRTREVLRRMLEDKLITQSQHDEAIKNIPKLHFAQRKSSIKAPHFVFWVKQFAEEQLGVAQVAKGVKIFTTLDGDLQKETEEIVQEEVEDIKPLRVGNGAAIVTDVTTGDIRAFVGSYNFDDPVYGKFNVVADKTALRQPGSTLKPFLVAYGIEKKLITAGTSIMDVKTTFPVEGGADYVPVNYDGKYRGPVQMRFALGNSLNIPMVKLLALIGMSDFLGFARDIGLGTLAPTPQNIQNLGLSAALGGGDVRMIDLAQAYTTLARGGSRIALGAVLEIQDHTGKRIYKRQEPATRRIFSRETAFIVSHILSDDNARIDAFGAQSLLHIAGATVAVKTGTTNDKRDNWAAGFTRCFSTIAWVGNNDNTPMHPTIASGVTGASPIWNRITRAALAHKDYCDGIGDVPSGVEAKEIDTRFGGAPKDDTHKRTEYFLHDMVPNEKSPVYIKIKMSRHDNQKKANDKEISLGQYDEKDFYEIKEKDPVSQDGKNRWQEAIDAWVHEQSDEQYKMPNETSEYTPEESKQAAQPTAQKTTTQPTTHPTTQSISPTPTSAPLQPTPTIVIETTTPSISTSPTETPQIPTPTV